MGELSVRRLWSLQRLSRDLEHSLWSCAFLGLACDVIKSEIWREYKTEAFDRPCRFESLRDFLVHEDGLRWPPLDETLIQIKAVADCTEVVREDLSAPYSPATRTPQEWARLLLKTLEEKGIPLPYDSTRTATRALHLKGTFAKSGDNRYTCSSRDNITARSQGEGGTSAGYLAARLKKAGRYDLLEQIGPDKQYRSVRAAAIEAGIIKDVPTVRLADPLKVAARIKQVFTPEQIHALIERLQE